MSEEQNIEQSLEDGKSERPEEVHSNISREQIITSAELSNQISAIPKSEIENMEVHHHLHIERKNFKEYFLALNGILSQIIKKSTIDRIIRHSANDFLK